MCRGTRANGRDVRLLSYLLPRLKALGRDQNHAQTKAGLGGEEGPGGHSRHVLQPPAGKKQRRQGIMKKQRLICELGFFQDYGKQSLEDLEEKEKEYKENLRRQREMSVNCENILVMHTDKFYGPGQKTESKIQRLERIQRMRRCRSMPKMTQEEVSFTLDHFFNGHLMSQKLYVDTVSFE